MISYPCIGRSSRRCRTRPLKSPFPKKWKKPPNFSGLLMRKVPSAGTRGSRDPAHDRVRGEDQDGSRGIRDEPHAHLASGSGPDRGTAEHVRDDPGRGRRNEPGIDLRPRKEGSDDAENEREQEERQNRRRDRALQRRGNDVCDPYDRGHVRERIEIRETDIPRQRLRDDECGNRCGAVVQRDDGGRDDQARGNLPEDEDLSPNGIREQEVAGPFLVLRYEGVRREKDTAQHDQETRERGERGDERVRVRSVRRAKSRREPQEQSDDQPDEDQDAQEASATNVLANLIARDRDDLTEGTGGHRRSDSWMRSR